MCYNERHYYKDEIGDVMLANDIDGTVKSYIYDGKSWLGGKAVMECYASLKERVKELEKILSELEVKNV